VKNAEGTHSSQGALVTFLIGSVACGWSMIIVPQALARGYLPAASSHLLPSLILVVGPYAVALYSVLVLSGSTSWNGSVIGDRQESLERFYCHMNICLLGIGLTGLSFSVVYLMVYESFSATHMFSGTVFLLIVLISLWSPKGGVLKPK